MRSSGVLEMTKHHAAGNDFLVLLDLPGERELTGLEVQALCDRHLGLGADGIIRVLVGDDGCDVAMDLKNADGGVAEMSGNGIRCLAQAAVTAGLASPPVVRVRTTAGDREVAFDPGTGSLAHATVDMGEVVAKDLDINSLLMKLGPIEHFEGPPTDGVDRSRWIFRAAEAKVGNPHLVLMIDELLGETEDRFVEEIGSRLERSVPGGTNVEFVRLGEGGDKISVRVYERGVGETLACGTGACAGAVCARRWGMVGSNVEVMMLGGILEVKIEQSHAWLRGPTRKVADVRVSEADLEELVVERSAQARQDQVSGATPQVTLIERTFRERIVLVGVVFGSSSITEVEADLEELALLVETAGADVVTQVIQRREQPDPATFLGRGKVEELKRISEEYDADTVVFDDEFLSGSTTEPRADPWTHRDRQNSGDPGHLRPERPESRRKGASRVGSFELQAPAPAGSWACVLPTSRRDRIARAG